MKHFRILTVVFAVFFLFSIPAAVMARDIEPVVSADWLEKNLANPKLVIIDIRKMEEYKAGHVPGAISVFYNIWAPAKGDLLNELPADDDLKDILSSNGIAADSLVVVVGKTDTPSDKANMTRVPWTLIYAGVNNVAILNGGFNKWTADGKKISMDAVKAKAKPYKGKFNKNVIARKDYVLGMMGKATIVDVREGDFYAGKKKLDFVSRPGHLKGAVNLPTMSQVFIQDGTYKDRTDLVAMAEKAVGADKDRELILYCDSGKVASVWWYILRESLGYKNVKIYDGSVQDLAKDANVSLEP